MDVDEVSRAVIEIDITYVGQSITTGDFYLYTQRAGYV